MRRMPLPVRFLSGSLLSILAMVVSGSEVAEPQIDHRDWYQIEILVFAQSSPRANDEAWPTEPLAYPDNVLAISQPEPTPTLLEQIGQLSDDTDSLIEESGPPTPEFLFERRSRHYAESLINEPQPEQDTTDGEMQAEDLIDISALLAPTGPTPFLALDADERTLNDLAGSLRRSSRYRTLEYLAWRQPIEEGDSWPVLFQAGAQYGDRYELDGILTIARSRYLHIDADLWLTLFTESDQPEGDPIPESLAALKASDFPALATAARNANRFLPIHTHRMKSSRRTRSGNLIYLDHPFFGVLIQIDRFQPETAD